MIINNIRSNHKQQLEESISPEELEEIKNLDMLEWKDDVREQIVEDIIERKIHEERVNLARSLLDVLDEVVIADRLGLDINVVKLLKF